MSVPSSRAVRSSRRVRGRERGAIAHLIVIATAISMAGIVVASEANIGGFAREERRLIVSDEAFALAESGIAVAREALERDASWAGLEREPLGHGTVDITVEHLAGGEHVVVATGRVQASVLGGRPGPIARRIRVRLARSQQPVLDGSSVIGLPGRLRVVELKEL